MRNSNRPAFHQLTFGFAVSSIPSGLVVLHVRRKEGIAFFRTIVWHPLVLQVTKSFARRVLALAASLLFFFVGTVTAGPRAKDTASFAKLHIPLLAKRPTIEDFLSMRPSGEAAAQMLKAEGFLQRDPKDGQPITQKTEVYLGYTKEALYVVCLCFDSEPNKIRAHMVRREQINDDDQFGFVLDTFSDRKTGVFFYANPYGVQQDGIWNDFNEPDYSYDMLWNSQGRITPQGFVLWFEIPFRSLRFPRTPDQDWGIFFERDIRRNFEFSFYPRDRKSVV